MLIYDGDPPKEERPEDFFDEEPQPAPRAGLDPASGDASLIRRP
jgi:hypothetical protein